MRLQGTLAVVTGASSGIGEAVAERLGREGAHVVLLARTASSLERVAAGIRANGGAATPIPVDLTRPDAVRGMASTVLSTLGAPDLVVNNAGAGRWLLVTETEMEEAVAQMASPYFAAFFVTRAFLPAMLERRSGRIAFVTSPASRIGWPGAAAYVAARFAVRGLFEGLRAELHGSGVGATLATFGKVSSAYFANNPGTEERIPAISRLMPTLTPEEAAEALVSGVRNERTEVVAPFLLRVFNWSNQHLPGLVHTLTRTSSAARARPA